jgi:hypothetical protein
MEQLTPAQLHQFVRRFRFKGGSLRRFQVRNHSGQVSTAVIRLTVREGDRSAPALLKLAFSGVEEYRFQRRPGPGLVKLKEVRLGHFNGLFYLNLDAFEDDGPLAIHDFRASDAFIAAREVSWEIVPPKTSPNT